ncbi:hybrid signal transduction histidine kinase E-like [Protopterus annectens]|uniref:hybrid signal transduction histidine kinase E-like n=1 Tax=Protopterus annectens TaxID=7888 RepID=UPI001CFA8CB6|nr:hybrid signal transduction histidine kinase E-like [Protopterus annectens]
MESGNGTDSQPLFDDTDGMNTVLEPTNGSQQVDAIGNLTALVNVLLGRVEALTQKVEASCRVECSNRTVPCNRSANTEVRQHLQGTVDTHIPACLVDSKEAFPPLVQNDSVSGVLAQSERTQTATMQSVQHIQHAGSSESPIQPGQRQPADSQSTGGAATTNIGLPPLNGRSTYANRLVRNNGIPDINHMGQGNPNSFVTDNRQYNRNITDECNVNVRDIPSMASFLNNGDFFTDADINNAGQHLFNLQNNNTLMNVIDEFDIKMFKCRKLQLEVSYLTECINKKVIPKGLRQWRFPAGLVAGSTFHAELLELFDRQAVEFLKALINFYDSEIIRFKGELESLDQIIKGHIDFSRYKFEYCRIYTSIDTAMEKFLSTKKRKLQRDITAYANNEAYPDPPPLKAETINNQGILVESNDQVAQNDDGHHVSSISANEPVQNVQLRRSERLINQQNNRNNNNNNCSVGNNNQSNQGFHPRNNKRSNNNRNTNVNSPLMRNTRRQPKR